MRLNELKLRNFKGARAFSLKPDGQDVSVFADNGVGKTTLFDAFTWVLFGKDSQSRADFEIKTLDQAGRALSKLDHEAELVLDLGGEELVLRKVYSENWVKKKGSAKDSFSGHTTDHFIDGVPVAKKEFDQRVAEIADEGVFRLLTDPAAFNNLHWQKRRELLLQVCGDVSDAEVITSNEDLAELPGILGKRSLEDHRKVIDAQRREINDELKVLPARVDEVTQGLPELPSTAAKKLEGDLAELREKRQGLEQERARVQAGGEIAEKQRRGSEIRSELQDVETAARGAIDGKVREAKQAAGRLQDLVDTKAREIRRLETELEDVQARIESLAKRLDRLREEWRSIDARVFEHTHDDDNCPVCGQELPPEQVQAAHAKALGEFNARKSRDLEDNKKSGLAVKAESDKLDHRVADLNDAIAIARREHHDHLALAEKATKEVDRLTAAVPDVSLNPKHRELVAEKARVEEAIEALRAGNSDALTEVSGRMAEVDEQLTAVQAELATFEQRKKGEQRIAELEAREKELGEAYEELERQLFLCETFTRSKVDLLTERINSKFELTQFKLFEEQVNGGLADACEAMHKGVPFGSLNHGARIQVGLDIVRSLQAHYGLFPPVWVDGKESVTRLPEMSCQLICLVVTPGEQKLRVETASKRQEVAA